MAGGFVGQRGAQRRNDRRLQRAQPRLPDPLPLRTGAAVLPVRGLRPRRLPRGQLFGRPLRRTARQLRPARRRATAGEVELQVRDLGVGGWGRVLNYRLLVPSPQPYGFTSRRSADAMRHARCSAVAPSTTVRCRVSVPAYRRTLPSLVVDVLPLGMWV